MWRAALVSFGALLLLSPACQAVAEGRITNMVAHRDEASGVILIRYDLEGAVDEEYEVSLWYVGAEFLDTLKASGAMGAVGPRQRRGRGKLIQWSPGEGEVAEASGRPEVILEVGDYERLPRLQVAANFTFSGIPEEIQHGASTGGKRFEDIPLGFNIKTDYLMSESGLSDDVFGVTGLSYHHQYYRDRTPDEAPDLNGGLDIVTAYIGVWGQIGETDALSYEGDPMWLGLAIHLGMYSLNLPGDTKGSGGPLIGLSIGYGYFEPLAPIRIYADLFYGEGGVFFPVGNIGFAIPVAYW